MDFHAVPTDNDTSFPVIYYRKQHPIKNIFIGFVFGVVLVLACALLINHFKDDGHNVQSAIQSLPLEGKKYNSTEDFSDAQALFVDNLAIAGWSISPKTGLPEGINNDSDTIFQGPRPKLSPYEINTTSLRYVEIEDGFTGPLPEKFIVDMQYDGPFRTNVKCGACWAFASANMLTYYHSRQARRKIIYSPQELLDCYSKKGCNGAKPEEILRRLAVKQNQQKILCEWKTYPWLDKPKKHGMDRAQDSITMPYKSMVGRN
ncbi:papain family cysteine protease domain-containing protein [Ditylenchus destructor]|nr:papain family cysteine protease domain-containing protein [Ditylenchus destructor]